MCWTLSVETSMKQCTPLPPTPTNRLNFETTPLNRIWKYFTRGSSQECNWKLSWCRTSNGKQHPYSEWPSFIKDISDWILFYHRFLHLLGDMDRFVLYRVNLTMSPKDSRIIGIVSRRFIRIESCLFVHIWDRTEGPTPSLFELFSSGVSFVDKQKTRSRPMCV